MKVLSVRALVLVFLFSILVFPLILSKSNPTSYSSAQVGSSKEAVVVQLNVPIDQGSAGLVSRAVSRANVDRAAAVIIDMNTPGGLLQDMVAIVDSISNSTVPVYTYVGNDSAAASAGSYIAMATDKIFMGPGSQIGPSTPYILGGGTQLEQNHTSEYAVSFLQSLAQEHGRNVTAATQMAAFDIAYSYSDALKYHVADASSNSLDQTLGLLNLSGASVVTISESPTEELISLLSDPTVDGIILLLGIVAIVLDFLHPTIVLSVAGAILIALGLIGAEAINAGSGTSAIAVPLILFAAAAALIVFEIKTGHGFMLFAGVIVGVVATILLAYQIPYSPSPFGNIQYVELAVFVVAGTFLALYARWVGTSLRRRKPVTGAEALIGKMGVAMTDLDTKGEVSVDGIIWSARTDTPRIARGSKVRILRVSGLTLEVEPEPIKQNIEL
ncbi:MAG: nodulation protein NfeD [Thaumarchaeota archaeon]|nr:nodulation protein NfeD [Nitrososphaerota archaeon]